MNLEAGKDFLLKRSKGSDIHTLYRGLGVTLTPLKDDTIAFKTIAEYVNTTHSLLHSAYRIQTRNVFQIGDAAQNADYAEFSKHITKKELLWHGSRMSNWSGILSQGLRIAPPEAPVTGYMFGKGLYFSNCVST